MSYEKLYQAVEKHKDMILEAERYIWKNPEPGYREWKTHAYLKEKYAGSDDYSFAIMVKP